MPTAPGEVQSACASVRENGGEPTKVTKILVSPPGNYPQELLPYSTGVQDATPILQLRRKQLSIN